MEESLKILKDIGAQQIHKDTHIAKEHVQAIIHGSYDDLNNIQFLGFVSILEREYKVDLSELKNKAKEHFDEIASKSAEDPHVFVTPEREQNNATVYVALGIVIFLSVIYYSYGYLSSMADNNITEIDNTQIEDAKKIVATSHESERTPVIVVDDLNGSEGKAADDMNQTESLTTTVEELLEEVVEEPVKVVRTLKILPKNKIWAGYINIETNQKYQKIFRKEFAIDVSENWLLLFGSGTVHLEVNGEKKTFSSKQNMRFKYVDGEFTKITVTEFKELNKGRKW
jgi:hypothetical protein